MKWIPFEKWVLFHHVVHCNHSFSSPLYKITCYGGDRVHRGCAVQEVLLCARDFRELTDFSQGFHRLLDSLFAWHIKEAAWESFPGLVQALLGQIKVKYYFTFKLFRGVYLCKQINLKYTYWMSEDPFSNSLIIHDVKTTEITTVKEVWIPRLN